MKYCSRCGKQLFDEAVVCPNCGCATESTNVFKGQKTSGYKTAAKVFMIIDTVSPAALFLILGLVGLISWFELLSWIVVAVILILGFFAVPLAWRLPMIMSYFEKTKNNVPVSIGFKVFAFFLVSPLGGIFMLCDSD